MTDIIDDIFNIRKRLDKSCPTLEKGLLYHYTSIEVLLSVLDNDTFWLGNSVYSNDRSEGHLYFDDDAKLLDWLNDTLGLRLEKNYDDYVLCLCRDGDKLSQWRGYCNNGGVAIGIVFKSVKGKPSLYGHRKMQFSVLTDSYEKTSRFEIANNTAIPIIYVTKDEDDVSPGLMRARITNVRRSLNIGPFYERAMLPYLKNDRFSEEDEFRIAFPNRNGTLDNCIFWQTKQDKQIVPYIKIRPGRISDESFSIVIDAKKMVADAFANHQPYIILPLCSNQEQLYKDINGQIEQQQQQEDYLYDSLYVLCDGHLPVREIVVSPSHNQVLIVDQINEFCKSKYWLSKVEVKGSEIPYIPSNE
jgi:hypothetical protein